MTLHLTEQLRNQIEARVRSGKYASSEDVLIAALNSLEQDERRGQFDVDEWDKLLADGEAGGGPDLDAVAVFKEIRDLAKPERRT